MAGRSTGRGREIQYRPVLGLEPNLRGDLDRGAAAAIRARQASARSRKADANEPRQELARRENATRQTLREKLAGVGSGFAELLLTPTARQAELARAQETSRRERRQTRNLPDRPTGAFKAGARPGGIARAATRPGAEQDGRPRVVERSVRGRAAFEAMRLSTDPGRENAKTFLAPLAAADSEGVEPLLDKTEERLALKLASSLAGQFSAAGKSAAQPTERQPEARQAFLERTMNDAPRQAFLERTMNDATREAPTRREHLAAEIDPGKNESPRARQRMLEAGPDVRLPGEKRPIPLAAPGPAPAGRAHPLPDGNAAAAGEIAAVAAPLARQTGFAGLSQALGVGPGRADLHPAREQRVVVTGEMRAAIDVDLKADKESLAEAFAKVVEPHLKALRATIDRALDAAMRAGISNADSNSLGGPS